MREKINIALCSTTSIEHHSHGKLSSCYTTTIPLSVPLEVARISIRQIAAEIAERINEDFRVEMQQENRSTYILTSVTKDIRADRYCFSVEYSDTVIDLVERYFDEDIEVDV